MFGVPLGRASPQGLVRSLVLDNDVRHLCDDAVFWGTNESDEQHVESKLARASGLSQM